MNLANVVINNDTSIKKLELSGSTTVIHLIYLYQTITTTSTTTINCIPPSVNELLFPGYPGAETCDSIFVTTSVLEYPNVCSIIERGIVYSLNPNPTISDYKVIQSSVAGEITTEVGSLQTNTGYYFGGYVTSIAGTDYIYYPYQIYTKNCLTTSTTTIGGGTTTTTTLAPTTTTTTLSPTTTTTTTSSPTTTTTTTNISQSLVNCWQFEEVSGTLYDSVGNSDLTTLNSISYQQSGKVGYSVSFNVDGNGFASAYAVSTSNINLSEFTISVWAKVNGPPIGVGNQREILSNRQSLNSGFMIEESSYNLNFVTFESSNSYSIALASNVFSDFAWHNIILTINTSTKNLNAYFDGSSILSNYTMSHFTLTGSETLIIGNWQTDPPYYGFIGNLDQIMVWNKILDSGQISLVYNSGNGISCNETPSTTTTTTIIEGTTTTTTLAPTTTTTTLAPTTTTTTTSNEILNLINFVTRPYYTGYKDIPMETGWVEGATTSTGVIYYMPYNADTILKVDPNTGYMTEITDASLPGLGDQKFSKSVLGYETGQWFEPIKEKIYGIPCCSRFIAVLDTTDDSISYIDTNESGCDKWGGAAYSPGNNCIYCSPSLSQNILKIDCQNDTHSHIGSFESSLYGSKWGDAVYSPSNQCIYCVPFDINSDANTPEDKLIIKINTNNDTYTRFGNNLHDGLINSSVYNNDVDAKWKTGQYYNGYIYFIPFNAHCVLKINTQNNDQLSKFGNFNELGDPYYKEIGDAYPYYLNERIERFSSSYKFYNDIIYAIPFESGTLSAITYDYNGLPSVLHYVYDITLLKIDCTTDNYTIQKLVTKTVADSSYHHYYLGYSFISDLIYLVPNGLLNLNDPLAIITPDYSSVSATDSLVFINNNSSLTPVINDNLCKIVYSTNEFFNSKNINVTIGVYFSNDDSELVSYGPTVYTFNNSARPTVLTINGNDLAVTKAAQDIYFKVILNYSSIDIKNNAISLITTYTYRLDTSLTLAFTQVLSTNVIELNFYPDGTPVTTDSFSLTCNTDWYIICPWYYSLNRFYGTFGIYTITVSITSPAQDSIVIYGTTNSTKNVQINIYEWYILTRCSDNSTDYYTSSSISGNLEYNYRVMGSSEIYYVTGKPIEQPLGTEIYVTRMYDQYGYQLYGCE